MYGYSKDFYRIASITYKICNGGFVLPQTRYSKILVRDLRQVLSKRSVNRTLLFEDILQQLAVIWIYAHDAWKKTQSKVPLRNYLVIRSIWDIKNWVSKELNGTVFYGNLINEVETSEISLFDIQFLLYGSSKIPFALLSPYERYLLYLRYGKDMTSEEIASTLHRTRKTIEHRLNSIINSLRSSYVKEDTGRSCSRRQDEQAIREQV